MRVGTAVLLILNVLIGGGNSINPLRGRSNNLSKSKTRIFRQISLLPPIIPEEENEDEETLPTGPTTEADLSCQQNSDCGIGLCVLNRCQPKCEIATCRKNHGLCVHEFCICGDGQLYSATMSCHAPAVFLARCYKDGICEDQNSFCDEKSTICVIHCEGSDECPVGASCENRLCICSNPPWLAIGDNCKGNDTIENLSAQDEHLDVAVYLVAGLGGLAVLSVLATYCLVKHEVRRPKTALGNKRLTNVFGGANKLEKNDVDPEVIKTMAKLPTLQPAVHSSTVNTTKKKSGRSRSKSRRK